MLLSSNASPKIETLVEDIYGLFEKEVHVKEEEAAAFSSTLKEVVVDAFRKRKPYLRLSNLGNSCARQLWFTVNCSELAEPMHGATYVKFLIGHVTEAVILFLARLAGHTVTDEQRELDVHGVKGHIDAVIDGELVDVKSASPYSFKKFEEGLTPEQDSFGYLEQLGSYGSALNTNRGHFLAVDKVLGKLHLDTHTFPEADLETKVNAAREMLAANEPPPRGYEDEPYGKSGNRKLGTKCSYCAFKDICWPGLQTYRYARGPVFLSRVVVEPKVEKD